MPRNVDAVALVFIVVVVLFFGFVADHGPWCFANGVRVGVVDDHGFRIVAPPMPRAPRMPVPPRMPVMPTMPTMPQLPRL